MPHHDAQPCTLKLIGAVKGMSDAQLAGSEITAMLDKVGLGSDGKHHHRTDTLSGGQKRKLSLACALIGDPKFVLLDEPTAGMDPASRRTVWQTISDAKAERAVVLTTRAPRLLARTLREQIGSR